MIGLFGVTASKHLQSEVAFGLDFNHDINNRVPKLLNHNIIYIYNIDIISYQTAESVAVSFVLISHQIETKVLNEDTCIKTEVCGDPDAAENTWT